MSTPTSDKGGATQVIRALRATGHTLDRVFNGEEDIEVSNETDALEAIFAVDDAYLWVRLPDSEVEGWVRFVLGNDPAEVVCDHTLNLSPTLDPLTESWWD